VSAVIVVITVILMFFLVGVMVGVVVVFALSARRAGRADHRKNSADTGDGSRGADSGGPF
jgi:MFS superfamily sulfate permease-like transporter